jgi:beta-glucosidase/6-phospho-beta-glucosidase/beta-galactosidase
VSHNTENGKQHRKDTIFHINTVSFAHTTKATIYSSWSGFVGISLNIVYKQPLNPANPQDVEAAERAMLFDLGWFANPIYGDGDYPEIMKRQVAMKSQQQGFPRSRLPEFTDAEKKNIKG